MKDYMTFEEFSKTDLAQAGLKAVYQVMKEAYAYYPTQPWRQISPETHIAKAFLKLMNAHENIESVDAGPRRGQEEIGTPSLRLFNWQLAMARLFFTAMQVQLPDLATPPANAPLQEDIPE